MSRAIQQKSRDFKTFRVEKRGKERDVRVPQFPVDLVGDALIRAVAKAAYVAAKEDPERATAVMQDWVTVDYKLNQRIVKPMINLMCRTEVDAIVRAGRPALRGLVSEPTPARLDGIRESAQRNIMEFPVRYGLRWIPLGDCDKIQLLAAADQRERSAVTMNADAVWFRRIAKELSEKQKVKTVLKPVDVERFRDQAHKVVA